MTNDMEQAVAMAARALCDMELRTRDGWEQTCQRMAEVALEAAAPVLAGELIACCSRLLERVEWAESEVVRLRDELGQPVHGDRLDSPSHRRGTHDQAIADRTSRSEERAERSGLATRNFTGGGQP
jgi:hypothetical protein